MKFNNNTKKTFLLAMIFASMMNSTAFASSFSDINNIQGKEYIEKFAEKGYIKGYEDGTFKPNNKITRFEMIKITSMLVRNNNYDKVQLSYADTNNIPSWVLNDVNNLYASKVIETYPNNLINGNENITRAEVVTMLSKALEVNGWDMSKVTQNVKTNKTNPLPTPTALPKGVIGYLSVDGTNIKNFPVKDARDNTEMLTVMKSAVGHFAQTPIFNGYI